MKMLVVYESKYGNTEIIAQALADKFSKVIPVELASLNGPMPSIAGFDVVLVGGPTQKHGISPTLRVFLDDMPPDALTGVRTAAFDTRLRGVKLLTGSAAGHIGSALAKKGGQLIADPESFLVTAGEGPLAAGELERARTWADFILEVSGLTTPELIEAGRP